MKEKIKKSFFISVLSILALFVLSFTLISGKEQKNFGFKLGLDLSGGTQVLYEADLSNISQSDIQDSLVALRDTIERRVNAFGIAEPLVQIETASTLAEGSKYRLLVELPGLEDTQKAVEMIGKTPVLEFRLEESSSTSTATGTLYSNALLTGAHIKKAFSRNPSPGSGMIEPYVEIIFNDEGAKIFSEITKENIGRKLGIFLDGVLISDPVIRAHITGGKAVITGNFTIDETRELARNLNLGALPVPIKLLSSQSVGASLGHDALTKGIKAALIGFAALSLFMILWYRLPGFIAVVSLSFYIVLMLAIFKYMGVTLTAAGIAGFILSLGMAVDANVLIFERMKEELLKGKSLIESIEEGVSRAWTSIRDGNLSSLITAAILFWFGTSLLKGFALVFAIGILVSMFSAIYITKALLITAASFLQNKKWARKLFLSGF